MRIPRAMIEKKLSSLLGMAVTIGKLDVSPLRGSLLAEKIVVAPMANVRRIRADISVAKALAKQINVKSLTVEGFEIALPMKRAKRVRAQVEDDAQWTFDAEKISLVDGTIRIGKIQIDRIFGDVRREGEGFRIALLGRIDEGEVKISGRAIVAKKSIEVLELNVHASAVTISLE